MDFIVPTKSSSYSSDKKNAIYVQYLELQVNKVLWLKTDMDVYRYLHAWSNYCVWYVTSAK